MEEAVRIADLHQDIELGIRARGWLIYNATFSGNSDKALVSFTWVLAQIDRDPRLESILEEEIGYSLMWQFKWISPLDFPHVTRKQALHFLDDMSRRYAERGLSQRAVEAKRSQAGRSLDDTKMTQFHFEQWKMMEPDGSEDCWACETAFEVRHHLFIDDLDQAMAIAAPLFEGTISCPSQPGIFSSLLHPLFQAGRLEEADRLQRRSQHQLEENGSDFTADLGEHIQFLTLTDQLPRAIGLFERHCSTALTCPEPDSRWIFLACSHLLFRRMEAIGQKTIKLRVHKDFPVPHNGKQQYVIQTLVQWLYHTAKQLGDQFDDRNGTTSYHDELAENETLIHDIQPLPRKASNPS